MINDDYEVAKTFVMLCAQFSTIFKICFRQQLY